MDKTEILEKIKAAGISEADIQAVFPAPATDNDLKRENEMLKVKADKLEEQRRQAIEIANKAIDEKKIAADVHRKALIAEILVDCNGKWTENELDSKSTSDLNLIKECFMRNTDDTFASIAAYEAAKRNASAPRLTAFGANIGGVV
jgi:hypothetical protein